MSSFFTIIGGGYNMANFTHYVKIKDKQGVNYYLGQYHIKVGKYTGVDGNTAAYLRHDDRFEVVTKNQFNKQFGIEDEEDEKEDD